MSATRQFFNDCAETWDEKNAAESAAVNRRLVRDLGIRPGRGVLDVGCSTGIIISWLLEAVGEEGRVTAMDIAERMLCIARDKYQRPNTEFIHADIARTPFLDCSFDEIVCHNCFPHVTEKEPAAWEMHRILKPGGKVVVLHNESRRSVNALYRAIGREAGGDMLPDGPEMKRIFSGAGFHDVAILEGDDRYVLRACTPVLREGRTDVSDTPFVIGLHDRPRREPTTSVEA